MTLSFNNGETTPPAGVPDQGQQPAPVNPSTGAEDTADTAVVFTHNGRQFTKADLIKKLDSADSFIDTLKAERAQDRAAFEALQNRVAEQLNAADLLKRVAESQGATPAEPKQPAADATETKALSTEEITKQVLAQLQNQNAQAKREENWNTVTNKLSEVYKDKTDEVVKRVAGENGLTLEEAAELAKSKPQIFLKLFPDLTKPAPAPAFHQGSRNSFANPAAEQRKPSGYAQATTTKDSVNIYLSRLKELSG